MVDRTALGEQAEDVFKEVKIEELMTLDSIYNIKGLDEKEIDRETKIHIATVQSLVKRILYPEGDTMPSVTDYDLIVVDEAHRGYILDKEMSETEMLWPLLTIWRMVRIFQQKHLPVPMQRTIWKAGASLLKQNHRKSSSCLLLLRV